jgi:putative transposase
MPILSARRKSKALGAKECSDSVVKILNNHLTIPINGKLNQKTIIRMLVGMASERQSIHSIRNHLSSVPCETSCRYHLAKLDLEDLEQISSAILLDLPESVIESGKRYPFAIDYTDDPYYGEIEDENVGFVRKSQVKCSTTKFYSYVTLYIMQNGKRFTLAVFPVRKDQSKTESIQRCLDAIFSRSFRIKVLCLDRGFYSIDVFNFLEERKIPFIIPIVKRGEKIKAVLNVSHSCYRDYTIHNAKTAKNVHLAVKVGYLKGNNGKKGIIRLGYVVSGVSWTPEKVYRVYKSRFGIESSYRMRNQVKVFTTSRNPTLRYLFVVISFLFENVWVAFQWLYFTPVRRGPRKVEPSLFRFERFRILVWEGIQTCLKNISKVTVLRYPI